MTTTHPTTPVSLAEKQQKRRQNIDRGLAAILEVLNSGTATRLPIVQSAFGVAARIFEISQKVRANQDEFVELAEEGCRLVYDISFKLADKQEIEPNLKANLEELLKTLQSIETFGNECAARGVIEATLMHGFDINEIKAQRRKLERCMRLFAFQSLLELREKPNQLVEQHGEKDAANNGHKKSVTISNEGKQNVVRVGDDNARNQGSIARNGASANDSAIANKGDENQVYIGDNNSDNTGTIRKS